MKYSITVSAVESWNKFQKQLKDFILRNLSPNRIKIIVSDLYVKSYSELIDQTKNHM